MNIHVHTHCLGQYPSTAIAVSNYQNSYRLRQHQTAVEDWSLHQLRHQKIIVRVIDREILQEEGGHITVASKILCYAYILLRLSICLCEADRKEEGRERKRRGLKRSLYNSSCFPGLANTLLITLHAIILCRVPQAKY